MSNTLRSVDSGWEPGHPAFDQWNEKRPSAKRIRSSKHQQKDRPSWGKQGDKHGRFCKHCKNTRYNLVRKNEALRTKEMEEI